jgi:hypothetical protein
MQGLSFSQLKISDFETYKGSMLDLQPHGLGTLSHHQERVLKYVVSGSWFGTRIEGYAEKTHTEGVWYKGWWRDNKLHGQGSYRWSDGTVYSGYWEDNMRTGLGVMKFSDGFRCEGEWYEDQLLETTAQVKRSYLSTMTLRQVDRSIYHSEDKPKRESTSSYQVAARDYSDDSSSSEWEDED